MITKNAIMMTMFSLVGLLALGTVTEYNNAFAEEANTKYKMADDVEAILTFTFRDGVEVHNFPIFKMGENFVDNSGITFEVEGVLSEAPHLHEALDQAYQYRLQTTGGSNFEYDYRYFEVDVDFVKHGEVIKTLNYYNCDVTDYEVKTLRDDQESYMSSKTGFAVVDLIDFNCGGLDAIGSDIATSNWDTERTYTDFGTLDYKFANDVRTFVTFEFDEGIERIEFPFFEITSGFEEDTDSVAAKFLVESVVADYPLLYSAIDKSRQVSGITSSSNNDFDAFVEFTKDGEILRALEYRSCIVEDAKITTLADKEDGFTGKSGFAIVNQIGFDCSGLFPVNDNLESLYGDVPVWEKTFVTNELPQHEFPTSGNVHAVTTFTHQNGQEIIDFPFFDQGDVLSKSNPTFVLEGIVDNTPLLYSAIDSNLKVQSQGGINANTDLFQVDVELFADGKHVRTFNYADCRTTDYVVESDRDKEDGYFKGFALANIIDFECVGYHPNNPVYDAMFEVEKADTETTFDLRNTDQWGQGFTVRE